MATQIRACSYEYDALDRLAARFSAQEEITNRFYRADTLAVEASATLQRRFVRGDRHLLAQQSSSASALASTLILPDRFNTVLAASAGIPPAFQAYCPYGYRESTVLLSGLPGFNGEQPEPLTGHYLLGNGYRSHNPTLMRFNSPDSLSPFGKGGLNTYGYCGGNPINRIDPTGHDLLDNILSGLYIAAGLATAAIGLLGARSSIPVLWKGVKVVAKPDSLTGMAGAASYRPATLVETVSAVIPVAAVVAGATWLSGFVVRTTDPDSQAARILSIFAVGISLPTLFTRGALLFRSERLKRQALTAKVSTVQPPTLGSDVANRGSVIRGSQGSTITRL